MPVHSERKLFLKGWRRFIRNHAYMRHVDELRDSYQFVCDMVDTVERRRYLNRSFSVPATYDMLKDQQILKVIMPMKEPEFRECFRVSKPELHRLYDLVGRHDVFHSDTRPQRHPIIQLAVLLYLLGSGNRHGDVQRTFGRISRGSVSSCVRRSLVAITSLFETVVAWPDRAERQRISTFLDNRYKLPDCVGFIDGSHILLHKCPSFNIEKNATFFSRKKRYGLLLLAVCDHQKRFIYAQTGNYASATDFRGQDSTPLVEQPGELFDNEQYVLGDSGFYCTDHVVPMYRRKAAGKLSAEQTLFNEHVAKARVKIEHAFGVLKQRWLMLSNMHILLKHQSDLEYAFSLIKAALVLHNLFIDTSSLYWDDAAYRKAQENSEALRAELEAAEVMDECAPTDSRHARRTRLTQSIQWRLSGGEVE